MKGMASVIGVRAHSWDRTIFGNVIGGEYGPIDFAGRTVVDVGAHIGSFSILAATSGARRILAYEAGAENFGLLARNCAALPAVECHHAAVWRSDVREPELEWREAANRENTGGGTVLDCESIAGEPAPAGPGAKVATVALDAIIARAGTVDLLKIDAEGSEYPILFTSRRLGRVGVIVGEYHEVIGLRGRSPGEGLPGWNVDRLGEHLERAGFRVTVRRKGPLGFFRAERGP